MFGWQHTAAGNRSMTDTRGGAALRCCLNSARAPSLLFALGVACTAAAARPPFLTDDQEPVGLHYAEINLIAEQIRAAAGRSGSTLNEVNIGCAAETVHPTKLPTAQPDHRLEEPVAGKGGRRVRRRSAPG